MERLVVANQWQDLNCLYPFYDSDGGNYTKVSLAKGTELTDRRKTKTVLGELARYFAVDLKSLRQKYGAKLDRKKYVPLPLHPKLVFISVKVREPMQKDEGAIAYINVEKVKGVMELKKASPYRTEVIFQDDSTLKVIQNSTTVKAWLKDAEMVRSNYLDLYTITDSDDMLRERLETLLIILSKGRN